MITRALLSGIKWAIRLSGLAVVLASLWGVLLQPAAGQGTVNYPIYQTLQTGEGQTLSTALQILDLNQIQPAGQLQFAFFFATLEQPVPSQFLDSITITLQDAAQATTLVCLTADGNGVYWAPVTPGALVLDPALLVRTPLSYQDHSQPWIFQTAYAVTVPLPAELSAGAGRLTLDLFDNGNGLHSMGWISAVPEPSTLALLLGASLLGGLGRKFRR